MEKQGNKIWREKTSPPKKSSSINDLPEEILLHVISFLPSIDAIKTSFLARPWRNFWHSVPTLYFDAANFARIFPNKLENEICELFTVFIRNRLTLFHRRQQHLTLHKFELRCGNDQYTRNNIGSWLRSVIVAKVVELDLDFSEQRYSTLPSVFELDSTLFFDLIKSSVEVLKLQEVYFRFPNKASPLRLESIREVHLERFNSTDKHIGNLIVSCVNLETACFGKGQGLQNLKIVSQKLKHLKLKCFNESSLDKEFSVEICAPSLISLDLFSVYADMFSLKSSPSLVEAKVTEFECFNRFGWQYWTNVVSSLVGVERLTIENMWPYRQRVHQPGNKFGSETFVFHNLKHLELWTKFTKNYILSLENLLRQCPQLVTMVLAYTSSSYGYCSPLNYDYNLKDMSDIVFRVPHLRCVEMKNFKATDKEMCVVNLLKRHGVVLEKIVAIPRKVDGKPLSLPLINYVRPNSSIG